MTTENTIVSKKDLQELQSISMALLSMSQGFDIPNSFRELIEDLNDKSETISSSFLDTAA